MKTQILSRQVVAAKDKFIKRFGRRPTHIRLTVEQWNDLCFAGSSVVQSGYMFGLRVTIGEPFGAYLEIMREPNK